MSTPPRSHQDVCDLLERAIMARLRATVDDAYRIKFLRYKCMIFAAERDHIDRRDQFHHRILAGAMTDIGMGYVYDEFIRVPQFYSPTPNCCLLHMTPSLKTMLMAYEHRGEEGSYWARRKDHYTAHYVVPKTQQVERGEGKKARTG